jgi:hypothetical protein
MSRRWPRRFVDSQPLGSLAHPYLSGRQRAMALDFGDKVTVGDVRDFLAGLPSRNELKAIFNTERRLQQLLFAVTAFDVTISRWVSASPRDQRLAWLLPNRFMSSVLDGRVTPSLAHRLEALPTGRRILHTQSACIWLPYIALETVNELKHLRNGDHATVSVMIARGCRRLGLDASARPWRPRFSTRVAALPIGWLFQFEPTPRGDRIIDRLARGGLSNMAHLAVLHPDAWTLLQRTPSAQWRALYRSLM